jgi:asparagine synthase (glutamine-hydrolysing)
MCGITGFYGAGDKAVLDAMTDVLSYRGPDDRGTYLTKAKGVMTSSSVATVGLGHRRLSIIDISSAGHQPMTNEDDTVYIVFNGEIYNSERLKSTLQNKHTFKGHSDTEIILHLYEEVGERVFEMIDGMFAIALYDSRIGVLFLARDRMGKKPLYWSQMNTTLLFGSELKALFVHPDCKKHISLSALNRYLAYEYVPTPHTMFEAIYKLEPGHVLRYDGTHLEKKRFWDITAALTDKRENNSGGSHDFGRSVQALDSLLENAVSSRLVADVPLGVFLSGGIDSSAIAWYAQHIQQRHKGPDAKMHTFSIGFKEDSFDESRYARLVAEHLGTIHHEQILKASECVSLIPEIFDRLDEPIADASIIPTYLLSRFTRGQVTVALSGDGGDELFYGYDTFRAHQYARIYLALPKLVRKTIEYVVSLLPTSFHNMSFDYKAKRFLEGVHGKERYRNQCWLGAFSDAERLALFAPKVREAMSKENAYADIDTIIADIRAERPGHKKKGTTKGDALTLSELSLLYQRTYLMDQVLVKVDRASMFNSLEVRSPLLDSTIVDFANALPDTEKLHYGTTKYILRHLLRNKLPKEIVERKKKGFGIPLAHWLRDELKPLVDDLLSERFIKKQGIFDPACVKGIVDAHMKGEKDNRKQLWTLLVFQWWWKRWMV